MKEKAILLLFIWFLSTASAILAEEPVYFADTNLKKAIEVELGVSDPNAADMLKLTFLAAWDRGITDITGFEYATNLTELYLYDNQLSDISSISGLVNLTHLSVRNNQISDISSISGLVNLTNLYLRNNQISNISALLELTNLTYLDLRGNPLSLDAFDIYIPQIFENNTGIYINYDPFVEYTLTISSTTGGSVTVPGEGSFSYPYGGIIPIIATADTGYHFLYWTGTAVDINKVANVMAADTTVNLEYSDYKLEAHFAKEKSVIYVDDDATGTNDGSTWENAYNSLQDALIDANATEKPVEICVAHGVYKPDQGFGIHSGDISASFNLINEVTLSGGFAGTNSVDPNARDIELYQTILSGDLENNDVLNGNSYSYRDSTMHENTRHILTAYETNETAILDGFHIVSGYSGGAIPMVFEPPSFYGGGMIIISANPIIANCTFNYNMVTMGGGAVAILEKSCPIITNCKFEQNYGWTGGGITISDSALTLIECRFYKNSASRGGAIFCTEDGSISLYGCSFVHNTAYNSGGAIKVPSLGSSISPEIIKENCFARVENCLFIGNTISNSIGLSAYQGVVYGGAWLTNCTFSGNRIIHGDVVSSDTLLENCIIWGNFNIGTHRQREQFEHNLTYHCCIQNSIFYPNGYGNIYFDPCFARTGYWANADNQNQSVDPNDPNAVWIDGDYHLKSQSGRWDPASQSWVVDDVTSPCIDAGDPNSPIGHEPFPNGGIINMGAYGGTPQASKSYILSKIIYVDDDAVGLNDGSSWRNAYTFLQDALTNAETSDKPVEIRVAQGVYKPDQRMLQTPDEGDNTFTLINEVTLKGGYAGFGEPDPNARNWDLYKSVLSGDLNGDDIIVEDPCDMLLIESNRGDNSRVVVRANHTDATAVLDGFIITGGYFMDMYTGPPNGGAGMHIYQGSPTIRNCTFVGNATRKIGGGLLNRGGSNPMLINCTFTGNYAESGGGIYNTPNIPAPWMISEGSHPTLVNCIFDNNYALKNGGGMYNYASNPTLIDCTFRRNQVTDPYSGSTRGLHTGGGGAMYNSNSNPVLTNCQFSENSAGGGGGICNIADSDVTLTNCTFKDNSASVIGGGLSNLENCRLTLANCKFINNSITGIGGGLANDSGNAMLVKCVFSGNQAHDWSMPGTSQVFSGLGGGMSNGSNSTLINCKFQFNYATEGAGMYLSGSPELIGCIFIGNYAIEDGGGIQNVGTSSEPVITNCIFSRNSANRGGGIFFTWGARMIMANCTFAGNSAYIGKTLASEPTKPSLPGYINLINCILWDGDNTIFDPEPYALRSAITYSNVQGGWPGEGNIDSDPCFADQGYWADADDPNIAVEPNDPNAVWIDGDYHLKSQVGRWDPASKSWVQDDITSPCIDAGDPNSPIGHEPFPNGGIINMGAYGGTPQASKSSMAINRRF